MTLLLAASLALACKPSWNPFVSLQWTSPCVSVASSPPVDVGTRGELEDGTPIQRATVRNPEREAGFVLELTNRCDDDLRLEQDPCPPDDCPFDGTIAPSETLRIHLEVLPERSQDLYVADVLDSTGTSTLEVTNDSGATFYCDQDGPLGCTTLPRLAAPLVWLARR